MQFHYLLFTLLISQCLAETKWVWERSYNTDPYATNTNRRESLGFRYPTDYQQYDKDRYREFDRIRDLERLRERDRERERERERERNRNRNRDREPITVRPYARPGSGQEDFDDYDTENYDQYRPQTNLRPHALPPRPLSPLPPLPLPPNPNLKPNPQNGILVGPDGPSGSIGRPSNNNIGGNTNRLTNGLQNPNDLRPNPANGVLVGPGGPTGIIGRPQFGNGGLGNNGFPPIGPTGTGPNSFGPNFPQLPPQGFPNQGNNGIRPLPTGPGGGSSIGGLYPNSNQIPGVYPGYPIGPTGIGSYGPGGNIYPGQYPNTGISSGGGLGVGGIGGGIGGGGGVGGVGGQQQGQYGFYPSQYYPIGGVYGGQGNNFQGNEPGNRPYPYPYNNELLVDNYNANGYYAPNFDEFGRSASNENKTKDKDSIKFQDRKVKKSVDDKLAYI